MAMMRNYLLPLLTPGLLAACGSAPPTKTPKKDPDRKIIGGGEIAPGWRCRTDEPGGEHNVRLVRDGAGYRAATGPNVIFYRPEDTAAPPYTLSVRIAQTSPTHAHGSGLFFGGQDLEGEGQRYSYFLLRGDGTFLVKLRTQDKTRYLTETWTNSEAVDVRTKAGRSANRLSIEVGREVTVFRANGFEVYRVPTSRIYSDGVFGLRFNHNLDLELDGIHLSR